MGETSPHFPEDPDIIQSVSWLKANQNYAGRESLLFDIDPVSLDGVDDNTWNRLMAEERKMRIELRSTGLLMGASDAEELASGIDHAGKAHALIAWAQLHKLNRAISMKKGADVLITGESQMLLHAASILQEHVPGDVS